MRRRLWLALVAGLAMIVPFVPAPAQAAAPDPVIFVHGWAGAAWNWDVMRGDFQRDGWPADRLFAWGYNSAQSNVTTANQLADFVNQVRGRTGAQKVDIVTHSMGGLSSRWYLKFLGGVDAVDDWVSVGGPNHGTNASYLCDLLIVSCAEMNYHSSFLDRLNEGDETPGAVHYGAFRSWCDEIINPDDSVKLDGATNVNVGCIGHLSLLLSWSVSQQVRDFVR
ncbi:esterase/lipase family protein [Streptosporangium sp. NPDC004379]|uniref:esterase/lipase family protein n=1 Tax=Streptosporangium sp. NPDC004379 TaxID=3366189 RepID=UPI0036AEEB55